MTIPISSISMKSMSIISKPISKTMISESVSKPVSVVRISISFRFSCCFTLADVVTSVSKPKTMVRVSQSVVNDGGHLVFNDFSGGYFYVLDNCAVVDSSGHREGEGSMMCQAQVAGVG